jgi:hypothetical protein
MPAWRGASTATLTVIKLATRYPKGGAVHLRTKARLNFQKNRQVHDSKQVSELCTVSVDNIVGKLLPDAPSA